MKCTLNKSIMWSRVYEILRCFYLKTLTIDDLLELTEEIKQQDKQIKCHNEITQRLKNEIAFLEWRTQLDCPQNDYY